MNYRLISLRSLSHHISASILFLTLTTGSGPAAGTLGEVFGQDIIIGPQYSATTQSLNTTRGDDCQTSDQNHICLGIKYVVYKDSSNNTTVSEQQAESTIQRVNDIWRQCDLSFYIENFLTITPAEYGLKYQTAHYSELSAIREKFLDNNTFLIVSTGPWDRSGSLGSTGANAWTAMPGGPPYGIVIERTVSTNANLIAHELGHYLNVLHVRDRGALMNPIVYTHSTNIPEDQCDTARSAAIYFWQKFSSIKRT
jgi:hypothetical protein